MPLKTRDVLYAPDGGPRPLRSNYGAEARTVRASDPAQRVKEQCSRQARLNREAAREERARLKELARVRRRAYNVRLRAVQAADARAQSERRIAGSVNDMSVLAGE